MRLGSGGARSTVQNISVSTSGDHNATDKSLRNITWLYSSGNHDWDPTSQGISTRSREPMPQHLIKKGSTHMLMPKSYRPYFIMRSRK